jgi:hypothetical protein
MEARRIGKMDAATPCKTLVVVIRILGFSSGIAGETPALQSHNNVRYSIIFALNENA